MNEVTHCVSARNKHSMFKIKDFIHICYPKYEGQISSMFGFVEKSGLNGGRVFRTPDLTKKDVIDMYDLGIALELPLANQHWNDQTYKDSITMLTRYHREGNIISCFDNRLNERIKNDFPKYKTKASVTGLQYSKKIIEQYQSLFDFVVLPTALNSDVEFLSQLENKHQIVIFGSAGCSANCPKKTCYVNISLANHLDDYDGFVSSCSKRAEPIIPREELGFVEYDIQPLIDLGFTRFKQMRPNPNNHFTYTH